MDFQQRIEPRYLEGLWELLGGAIATAFSVLVLFRIYPVDRIAIMLIIAILGSILGLILISGGTIHLVRVIQYRYLAKETVGKVLDREVKEEKVDWETYRTYSVKVTFNTIDREINLNAVVNSRVYSLLHPGKEITVRYLAADPRAATFEGEF